ncbi:MAG TPA: hypothetical protein VKY74_04745 [Chloroflexia bacterium]|nr:hypothetical protein [Chloroflexia bacterium]
MTSKEARHTVALQQLRELRDTPAAQVRYAMELLDRERGFRVVAAALAVLAAHPGPGTRASVLPVYAYYDADGVKRDPSCELRVAALTALQPVAEAADSALAERAVTTYEFLPPTRAESATSIRAAGLLLLAGLDPPAASYHAVRLLTDPYTARMSGQPALTAARVLADQGQTLPLYYYAVDPRDSPAEVRAECLRSLSAIPATLLAGLVAQYRETREDLVLAGLFDLVLEHPAGPEYAAWIAEFLHTTRRYPVYHYLVTALVATRQPTLIALLLAAGQDESDPRKREILAPALDLAHGDPAAAALAADLRRIP